MVREISTAFDRFWNGTWSVPIAALADRPYDKEDLQAARSTLREMIAADDYPYPLDRDIAELRAGLKGIFDSFIWAPGYIVWDDPSSKRGGERRMLDALQRRLRRLNDELLIESAYFIPRDRGVGELKGLHERGVRIRVLTNSLASNDVLAAHAGYSMSRKQMIKNGVELYELRPDPGAVRKKILSGTSKAALHTKAIVFDRKDVFIGSFNLDPRSGDINTEAGLYVESPELAAQVIAYLDEGVRLENSYRVLLDADGDLYWITESDGVQQRFDKDPKSTATQRSVAGFIRMLPVIDQL